MRFQIFILTIILSFLIGCGGNETPNKPIENKSNITNSTSTPNKTTSQTNTTNAVNTTNSKMEQPIKTPVAQEQNRGETLKSVVDGFYAALAKKDEANTKNFLSADALKYWETEAKSANQKWLIYLLESEEPVTEKREIRNEKISGDSAFAEIKGGSLGEWTPIAFVKENGQWKFASPEKSMEQSNIQKK
jgi:hypothetical protein